MYIKTNIQSAVALNQTRINSGFMQTSMERLSSGLRINKGADDPSGLAISEGMAARLRGLNVSMENVEDAINMIHTADEAIGESMEMLLRIRDLCLRGGNEAVITSDDRSRLQAEINSLIDGIHQIGLMTEFNTKKVSGPESEYQYTEIKATTITDWTSPGVGDPPGVGESDYEAMKARVLNSIEAATKMVYGILGIAPGADFKLQVRFMDINADQQGSTLAQGGSIGTGMFMNIDVYNFLDTGITTARVGNDPSVHGFSTEMVIAHEMTHAIISANTAANGAPAGSSWGQEMTASIVSGEVDRRISGDQANVIAAIGGVGLTSAPGGSSAQYAEVALAGLFIRKEYGFAAMREVVERVVTGTDFDAAIADVLKEDYASFADFETAADAFSTSYANGSGWRNIDLDGYFWANKDTHLNFGDPDFDAWTPLYTAPATNYFIQIGPDTGSQYAGVVTLPWLTAGNLDYAAYANVYTTDDAGKSVDIIDDAFDNLNTARAALGIQENRMRAAVSDMSAEAVNVAAAKSRIMDADMASEYSDYIKRTLISQTAMSAAATANANPSNVLSLIEQNLR